MISGNWISHLSTTNAALVLEPNNAKCETNLAGILVSKGLRTEARRRYEHSLLLKPDLQIAHKELADILCGQGEYDLAIAHYEEALRIQPDFKRSEAKPGFCAYPRRTLRSAAEFHLSDLCDLDGAMRGVRKPLQNGTCFVRLRSSHIGTTGAAPIHNEHGPHRHPTLRF